MVPPMRGAVHGGGASIGDVLAAFLPLTGLLLTGFWLGIKSSWGGGGPKDDGENGEDGGPGRGPWRPRSPTGPPEPDPYWWPDFEREFAAYVVRARADRAPQRVSTVAGAP
jgi:hypothetical protein